MVLHTPLICSHYIMMAEKNPEKNQDVGLKIGVSDQKLVFRAKIDQVIEIFQARDSKIISTIMFSIFLLLVPLIYYFMN